MKKNLIPISNIATDSHVKIMDSYKIAWLTNHLYFPHLYLLIIIALVASKYT
jgi:hypothetical protein